MSGSSKISRRDLFVQWFKTAEPIAPASRPKTDPKLLPGFLRPPGAIAESEFVSRCERCHACLEACPHDVILPLGPAYAEADGTPAILPRDAPCRICSDLPCVEACPSGALRLPEEWQIKIGVARLDPSLCWSVKGQPCDYCLSECPLRGVAITWDVDRPRISEEACTGCGRCAHICTATPGAIRIDRLEPDEDKSIAV